MGFGSKIPFLKGSKISHHNVKYGGLTPLFGLELSRKKEKKLRSKLGLTAKSKWIRSLKRQINGGSVVSSSQPVSAGSVYQHNARTLSQMTGGV